MKAETRKLFPGANRYSSFPPKMESNGTTRSTSSGFEDNDKALLVPENVSNNSIRGDPLQCSEVPAPINQCEPYDIFENSGNLIQNSVLQVKPRSPNRGNSSNNTGAECGETIQSNDECDKTSTSHTAGGNLIPPSRPVDVALDIGFASTPPTSGISIASSVIKKCSAAWERCRHVFKSKSLKMNPAKGTEEIGMVAIDMKDDTGVSDSEESFSLDESSDSDDEKWEKIATFSAMKKIMASRRS